MNLVRGILIAVIIFEVIVFLQWFSEGIVSNDEEVQRFVAVEISVFYIFSFLSPYLMLICVFAYLFRPFIGTVVDKLRSGLSNFEQSDNTDQKYYFIILGVALVFPLVFGTFVYLPSVNPFDHPAGVDLFWYNDWIIKINENGLMTILNNWFLEKTLSEESLGPIPSDRAITMMLLYFLQWNYSDDPMQIIKYTPILFQIILSLSILIFLRLLTSFLDCKLRITR